MCYPALCHQDFAVCALDLLSAFVENLGGSFIILLQSLRPENGAAAVAEFCSVLVYCLADNYADLRQSAFALVGECFKSCPALLASHLDEVFREVPGNLDPVEALVCNNCVWSVGEAVGAYGGAAVQRHLTPSLIAALIELINSHEMVRSRFAAYLYPCCC